MLRRLSLGNSIHRKKSVPSGIILALDLNAELDQCTTQLGVSRLHRDFNFVTHMATNIQDTRTHRQVNSGGAVVLCSVQCVARRGCPQFFEFNGVLSRHGGRGRRVSRELLPHAQALTCINAEAGSARTRMRRRSCPSNERGEYSNDARIFSIRTRTNSGQSRAQPQRGCFAAEHFARRFERDVRRDCNARETLPLGLLRCYSERFRQPASRAPRRSARRCPTPAPAHRQVVQLCSL